jgi:hypothetical protein
MPNGVTLTIKGHLGEVNGTGGWVGANEFHYFHVNRNRRCYRLAIGQ